MLRFDSSMNVSNRFQTVAEYDIELKGKFSVNFYSLNWRLYYINILCLRLFKRYKIKLYFDFTAHCEYRTSLWLYR